MQAERPCSDFVLRFAPPTAFRTKQERRIIAKVTTTVQGATQGWLNRDPTTATA